MSNYDDAQWLIQIDRDVFAVATQQVTTGGDPWNMIHQLVQDQPEELQLHYTMELCRRLARNLGNLMADMHGGQDAARAAITASAVHYEQTISAGVWTTTTTPPPDDGDSNDGTGQARR